MMHPLAQHILAQMAVKTLWTTLEKQGIPREAVTSAMLTGVCIHTSAKAPAASVEVLVRMVTNELEKIMPFAMASGADVGAVPKSPQRTAPATDTRAGADDAHLVQQLLAKQMQAQVDEANTEVKRLRGVLSALETGLTECVNLPGMPKEAIRQLMLLLESTMAAGKPAATETATGGAKAGA